MIGYTGSAAHRCPFGQQCPPEPAAEPPGETELRELAGRIADELVCHQGLRGPMDPERPDVWQNRCECGWDDGDERPGWRGRYRLHVADRLLTGPLRALLADAARVAAVRELADDMDRVRRDENLLTTQGAAQLIRHALGGES